MIYLNHIGIAVSDLGGLRKLLSLLGLDVSRSENVPEQGVKTHFLPIPSGPATLELLEVMDPAGTVAQFLKKKGPGVHHLSFSVGAGELGPLCEKLRASGYRLVYPQPVQGAHHMKVNFIHPASAGGVLLELMEPEAGESTERGR